MMTPPGWYPDPGHPGKGPPRERWWDGAAWTEQTRRKGPARGPLVAGIVGALVLVAAMIVGGFLYFGPVTQADDTASRDAGGNSPRTLPSPSDPGTSPDGPGQQPPDGQEQPPGGNGGGGGRPPGRIVPTGVELPLLPGWERAMGGAMVTTGPYKCPGQGPSGESADCLRGAAMVVPSMSADGLKATATADVEQHAEEAYTEETYGGITSHEVLASEETTIAGQDAYRVRWKITNETKPDAYVESIAFEPPGGAGGTLVLRTSFDIHDDAPPLSDMDKLAEGVKEGELGAGTGGGDGSGKEI